MAFTTYLENISPEQSAELESTPHLFLMIASTMNGQMAFLRALNYFQGGDLHAAKVEPVFVSIMLKASSHAVKQFCYRTLAPVVQGMILEHCPEFAYEGARVTEGKLDLGSGSEQLRRQRLLQVPKKPYLFRKPYRPRTNSFSEARSCSCGPANVNSLLPT